MKSLILTVMFLVSLVSLASANIDARKQGGVVVGTSVTWSHTTSGTNRAMFVCVPYVAAGTPTFTVSYDGAAMTELWHRRSTSDVQGTAGFILVAPNTGVHNVSVVSSVSTSAMTGFSLTMTDVNQATPTRTVYTGHDTGSGAISQTVVDSVSSDLVVDCDITYAPTITKGSGQSSVGTKDNALGGGARSTGLSTEVASGGNTVMSWTGGSIWAGGAVAVNGAGTGYVSQDCTGSSPNLTAASTDQGAIEDCYNLAVSGDTITVTPSTVTWPSNLILSKNITVICATPPTCVATGRFETVATTSFRFSGFTLNVGTNSLLFYGAQGFRFDHNVVVSTTGNADALLFYGTATPVEGLIDNNTLTDVRAVYYGDVLPASGTPHGMNRWFEPENMGTLHAVYFEDNEFSYTVADGLNTFDANWGARMVARFNTLHSGRFEVHGVQAQYYRGQRLWEFYGNVVDSTDGNRYRPFFIRGGTGVVFRNNYDGGFTVDTIDIDGPRQVGEGSYPVWGFCDGTSYIDENTATFEGWRCRDQIGMSTDASLWNGTNPAPVQAHTPAMFFKNIRTDTNAEMVVIKNLADTSVITTRMNHKQILPDRDYYTFNASFDGTSGVGYGTRAARPATCTTGVAYWATDQGSWNLSSTNPWGVQFSGADGVLDKCTATDTWTDAAYVPYTYPHPLQGAPPSPTPDPPTAPRAIGLTTATSATLVWVESTDVTTTGYNVYRSRVSGEGGDLVAVRTPAIATATHSPLAQAIVTSTQGGTFYYTIAAVNSVSGVGVRSAEVPITFTALSRTAAQ